MEPPVRNQTAASPDLRANLEPGFRTAAPVRRGSNHGRNRIFRNCRNPRHLAIEWVVNPHPGHNSDLLVERVRNLPWQDGDPSVWPACEFASMRKLRDYFRGERGLDSSNLYISSYWKTGSNEDNHKIAKREDATTAA